jgi:hypothetical protein
VNAGFFSLIDADCDLRERLKEDDSGLADDIEIVGFWN